MSNSRQSPKEKYLPFKRFHQAPIDGLSPRAIKNAAQQMLKVQHLNDREKITLETAQNFICKSLGFRGGLAGFQKEYRDRLHPFMKAHGLVKPENLVGNGNPRQLVNFDYRQIAERLFRDDKVMPNRVFTGLETKPITVLLSAWESPNFSVSNWATGEKAEPDPNQVNSYDITNSEGSLTLGYIFEYMNMLGDQFLDYSDDTHAIEVIPYAGRTAVEECYIGAGKVLRSLLLELNCGWVDIIPYNENLIFLRYKNGRYDFVFRGMRDAPFQHNPYLPYLRNADVPITENDYDFKRWLYFPSNSGSNERRPYTGWLEFDKHEAAKMFGGIVGDNEILRDYLIGKGQYEPPQETADRAEGFHPCIINAEKYYVSNLISQRQFDDFMDANHEYRDYSRIPSDVDDWRTVNRDEGDLPAAVTWYDAMAYAAWISKTKRLPVRLPTEQEYRSIAFFLTPVDGEGYFETHVDAGKGPSGTISRSKEGMFIYKNTGGDVGAKCPGSLLAEKWCAAMNTRICRFERADGAIYSGNPPYMAEEDFQKLIFKFDADVLPWKKSDNGLRFINSPYFGEWLKPKGAAIDTFLLCSLRAIPGYMPRASRERFPPTSTGKYKYKKIGFRLIYKAA